MPFPDTWPDDCPPNEAEDATDEVFRIVKNNPAVASDMLSHFETGKLPHAPPCLRCGLSVFRLLADALNQQGLMPRLGKRIAKGELRPEHGRTLLTPGQQPTHTTWWVAVDVDRAALFVVVKEVP